MIHCIVFYMERLAIQSHTIPHRGRNLRAGRPVQRRRRGRRAVPARPPRLHHQQRPLQGPAAQGDLGPPPTPRRDWPGEVVLVWCRREPGRFLIGQCIDADVFCLFPSRCSFWGFIPRGSFCPQLQAHLHTVWGRGMQPPEPGTRSQAQSKLKVIVICW